MPRRLKIPLIIAAVIFGLLLLSMLIVPWQIKKQGSQWIADQTSRTLTIEKAYFNPFTLTVELGNLKLTEQQSDRTFVSFSRLMISASLRSLIDQALILSRVELDDPFVNIELLGKQNFNFSDFTRLGSDNPQPEVSEPKKPFRFSLNNIILSNGSVDFTDKTSELETRHQIRQFDLNVPFVGNVTYLTDEYVQPQLSMLLNGAELQASGQLKPFHDSFETNLFFTLEGADLAWYAYHSPVPLPIEVQQGDLDCEFDLAYRVSKNEEPKLMLGGMLALTDIDLREKDGTPLLSVPTLILDLDWADLFRQDINLAALEIFEPQVYIDRDSSGSWNFERVAQANAKPETPEKPEEDSSETGSLPLIFVESFQLSGGQVHYRDDAVAAGFSEHLSEINFDFKGISTHESQKSEISAALRSDSGFSIQSAGFVGITPATAELTLAVEQLDLKPFYPYAEPFLNAAIEGLLSVGGQIKYLEDGNLLLEQGRLNLTDLQVPFDKTDLFKLAELAVDNVSFNLKDKTVSLEKITLDRGDLNISTLADGSISALQLVKTQSTAASEAEIEEEPTETDSRPWDLKLASLDLQQFSLSYTDKSLNKKPRLTIPRLDVSVQQLRYPESDTSPFKVSAVVGKEGSIKINGSVAHTPLKLKADTNISKFPLADFNDFIPESVNLNVKDGRFFTNMSLSVEQRDNGLSGDFSGKTSISRFNLRDPLGDGELLAWDNLYVDGINGKLNPFSLHIQEVALNNYLANILISADGRVNLASITAENGSEAEHAIAEKSEEAQTEVSSTTPPDIRIDALTLQGGTVSFVDRSMKNLFSTTMYELGGRVTGMASDEQMRADVDLRGQLENHSPLTISGLINPLSKDLFADLTISFKDIDLTPMTPYSGTYLGRVIDKGKLYLDLSYHIEKRKISADNKVLIDQFTLGDSVDSDKAISLPLNLAIALLKDNNDEIHLDVPVYGDLDDPNFSVAGVIFTVIKNLILKAATSPFSLLTSVLGSGDEDFTSITFADGRAFIDENQLSKLRKLADVLLKRPSLTLEISAFADRESDPEGYRREQLRQMVVETKRKAMIDAGAAPAEEITYSEEEYPELILSVYQEATFPRPRNAVGMLQKLPVEEMEKLLLANILVGDEELAELAKTRALAVRDALVATDETIKPRLFLTKKDIFQAAEKGPNSRVEFSVSVK